MCQGLITNALPRPPRSSAREEHQAQLWQRLLTYERTNPQRLEPAVLRIRVSFAYNQCLLCLYFYPSIWCVAHTLSVFMCRRYEFASWLAENGAGEQATIQVYDRALAAIPNSLVRTADDRLRCLPRVQILHFSKADYLESTQQIAAAETVYTNLTTQKVQMGSVIACAHPRSPIPWCGYST